VTPVPGPTETPTATAQVSPTPLSAPTVLDHYPLQAGSLGQSLAVGGGRVWIGTASGAVEARDAASGALLESKQLVIAATGDPAPVRALVFDGERLWALVEFTTPAAGLQTRLFVLDSDGAVLREHDLTDLDPYRLGSAPGQVWTRARVFDTASQAATAYETGLVSPVFAYDEAGWMWVGGGENACDTCPAHLYRYRASSPAESMPGPTASQKIVGLAAGGGRLWALTGDNHLHAYNLAAPPGAEDSPALDLDLSDRLQFPPAAMLYAGQTLWLLGGAGRGGGALYPLGAEAQQPGAPIAVGEGEGTLEQPARVPVALAYDGRDLWVLTALDLVRVGLPGR
jgi:hypothetical protein